jgi:hypothetical protein
VNRLGFLRNSTNSITSRLASSTPATSLNDTFT